MDDSVSRSTGPTDHGGLEVLTLEECERLLASQQIGRIAFISAGEPMILPVNYRVHDGHIVFRTTTGDKLDAARNASSVGFEVDDWDVDAQTGWSVVIAGAARDVDDDEQVAELEALGLRPWADAVDRTNWVRVFPHEVSGRRII